MNIELNDTSPATVDKTNSSNNFLDAHNDVLSGSSLDIHHHPNSPTFADQPTSPSSPPSGVKYREDFTIDIEAAKQSASKSTTSRSKTVSSLKSRDSDIIFTIHTCVGKIQLSKLRLFSLVSLFINLASFVILAGLIIAAFVLQDQYNNFWEGLDTDTTYYRQRMISASRMSVFSNGDKATTKLYYDEYVVYMWKFSNNTGLFKTVVPESVRNAALKGKTNPELDTTKAVYQEQGAMFLAMAGNYTTAMYLLNSATYKTYLAGYDSEFQIMVDYVQSAKKQAQNVSVVMVTVSLAVILFSLVLVVPVIISSFVVSIKKDESVNRKLNQARTFLLIDTMQHAKMRQLFRKHCETELSLENFQLLEKITDYKMYCERSFEIQEYLYESSERSDTISDISAENKKKGYAKKKFNEKDLLECEKKKYEIAFEIYSEFLDVRGEKSVNLNKQITEKVKQHLDLFATGQNEHLIDSLFEQVEAETCIVMLDSHHRFKQTIEFQKQAKKDIITSKKKH